MIQQLGGHRHETVGGAGEHASVSPEDVGEGEREEEEKRSPSLNGKTTRRRNWCEDVL